MSRAPVELKEIVWPYRPDILIRLDFLQWYEEVGQQLLAASGRLTPKGVLEHRKFMAEAVRHPYFISFTRKTRYRRLNLSRVDSESVFAEGIAAFVNLLEDIRANGFDRRYRIGLTSGLFLLQPVGADLVRQRYYIGDGCHRFSCGIWLSQGSPLPAGDFRVRRKLLHRPECAFGNLMPLNLLDAENKSDFDRLFRGREPSWQEVLAWGAGVRQRFRTLDLDDILSVQVDW